MAEQKPLSPTTIKRAKACLLRIEGHCADLIDRDTEDQQLRDARCLITSVLMHASGIIAFLRAEAITADCACAIRAKIHQSFGAPGDWGGDLGAALSEFYRLPFYGEDSTDG